jgi:hypothetical protein
MYAYCRVLIGLAECQKILVKTQSEKQRNEFLMRQRNLRQVFKAFCAVKRTSQDLDTATERNAPVLEFIDTGGAESFARAS